MTKWILSLMLVLLSGCTVFNQLLPDYINQSGEGEMTGNADVVFVRAVNTGENTWTFHVTIQHPDTGWEDYADGWDIALPDGTSIIPNSGDVFTRVLLHPHDAEPFTRSQSNIVIPDNVTTVIVRAHDIVDAWGGQEITVDLTQSEGEGYTVE